MVKSASKASSTSIQVTVAKLGEAVITLTLPVGVTVSETLDKAGYTGHSARVNEEAVTGEDILEDGDELFVGTDVKAGL